MMIIIIIIDDRFILFLAQSATQQDNQMDIDLIWGIKLRIQNLQKFSFVWKIAR